MIGGFTPLFDVLLDERGIYTASVYGKIYRYCNWSPNNICNASNARLADELGVSKKTVQREKRWLEEEGYLTIMKTDRKPDICRVNHEAIAILMKMEPPQVGGDTQSIGYGLADHSTMDTQSTKESIQDSIEDSKPFSPKGEDEDPFGNVSTPVEEIVKGFSGGEVIVDEAQHLDDDPEPRYVTDPFEDGEPKKPKWKVPKTLLQSQALAACGREYFASREERSAWNGIEKSAVVFKRMPDANMHIEWIEEKIAFVERSNQEYRKQKRTKAVRWTFPKLISMISNEAKRKDWVSHRRVK